MISLREQFSTRADLGAGQTPMEPLPIKSYDKTNQGGGSVLPSTQHVKPDPHTGNKPQTPSYKNDGAAILPSMKQVDPNIIPAKPKVGKQVGEKWADTLNSLKARKPSGK